MTAPANQFDYDRRPGTPGYFTTRNESYRRPGESEMVGESTRLKNALQLVNIVGLTDSTVLLLGETGTGKGMVASMIHNISPRHSQAVVKVNCAAIPLGLLESELFGHERGAFTGAIDRRIGRFELANKGTLFLDEIGDIPPELQPKLLRVLQEREFERLGSTRTVRSNARLVTATHRDLAGMVKEKTFREDLYYRLRVFPIRVPALRERAEDIPELVWHFVELYSRRMNKSIDHVPVETMEALTRYSWPGNIRELRNVIERTMILSSEAEIDEDALPKVFEPYFTSKPMRTGLGLTHTQKIVLNHNGMISVESVKGAGTTCTIQLEMVSE